MVKNMPTNAGVLCSILGLGGSPGEGNGNPLHYSCLGNPVDKEAWQVTVYGVSKSWPQSERPTHIQEGHHIPCLCKQRDGLDFLWGFLLTKKPCSLFSTDSKKEEETSYSVHHQKVCLNKFHFYIRRSWKTWHPHLFLLGSLFLCYKKYWIA